MRWPPNRVAARVVRRGEPRRAHFDLLHQRREARPLRERCERRPRQHCSDAGWRGGRLGVGSGPRLRVASTFRPRPFENCVHAKKRCAASGRRAIRSRSGDSRRGYPLAGTFSTPMWRAPQHAKEQAQATHRRTPTAAARKVLTRPRPPWLLCAATLFRLAQTASLLSRSRLIRRHAPPRPSGRALRGRRHQTATRLARCILHGLGGELGRAAY